MHDTSYFRYQKQIQTLLCICGYRVDVQRRRRAGTFPTTPVFSPYDANLPIRRPPYTCYHDRHHACTATAVRAFDGRRTPTLALTGKGRHGVTCSQNKAGAGCGKQKRMKHLLRRHPILLYNHSFFPESLLSDSNQRPRDYKSRALAN